MESKIEKIDYILIEGYDALKPERKGDVDYNYLAEKINEIIDHLNSQDQEEEVEESVWDMLEREEDGYIKEISNYWQKNGHKHIEIEIVPNEPDEPEKVYVDPIVPNFTEELSWPVEYKTRKQVKEMFKDTPEQTESEVQEWEEEWHSTPVYNQISFIKNLLEEREDRAREEGFREGADIVESDYIRKVKKLEKRLSKLTTK